MTVLPRNVIAVSDCLAYVRSLPDESVNCVITSPPYWQQRAYGVAGEWGSEDTVATYVANLVALFREIRRVLRSDGTAWLNLGDKYVGKSLLLLPHRVAIALMDDGWIVRQEVVWQKPNPLPESVKDRPTRSHEYVFLLTKSPAYWYDIDALKTPIKQSSIKLRGRGVSPGHKHAGGAPGQTPHSMAAARANTNRNDLQGTAARAKFNESYTDPRHAAGANARSVWTISTRGFKGAHFATFPPELVRRCLLAGSPRQCCAECGAPYRANARICACSSDAAAPGVVLDPFMGAGTTALVAVAHGRDFVGCDLNPEYVVLARERLLRPNDSDRVKAAKVGVKQLALGEDVQQPLLIDGTQDARNRMAQACLDAMQEYREDEQ